MIYGGICIDSKIICISMEYGETTLVQGVSYDPAKNCIVDNISRKVLFDLGKDSDVTVIDRKFSGKKYAFVYKPGDNITRMYKINDNNTISIVSHLYIQQESGVIFLIERNKESFFNVLIGLPKEYTGGTFINLKGTYTKLDWVNWDEVMKEED